MRGCGTLAKEKPPIFGAIQRGGEVVIQMLENVKQVTIKPIIERVVLPGTLVYTDEYECPIGEFQDTISMYSIDLDSKYGRLIPLGVVPTERGPVDLSWQGYQWHFFSNGSITS